MSKVLRIDEVNVSNLGKQVRTRSEATQRHRVSASGTPEADGHPSRSTPRTGRTTAPAANFNVSAYSRLEHGWRKALRDECSVEVDIAMVEDETEAMWSPMMIVTYWEDGEEWEITMLNEPHAQ